MAVFASPISGNAVTANVATSETTGSTTYVQLTTTTDAVTVSIGTSGACLLVLTCDIANSGANFSAMSYTISGANTFTANDTNALANSGTTELAMSWSTVLTGLTAGSTTFTAKYRVSAGTGTFKRRFISVIPL